MRQKYISFDKGIFRSGKYIPHFEPDDKKNPFRKIYEQKRRDTLHIINASNNSKSILDVGGGMGRLAIALVKPANRKIYLADISVDMIKLALKNGGKERGVYVANSDAHKLPFRNDVFDFVVGLDLLCHLENPELALLEFYRVLNNEGILILDSTNSNPLWALFYPRYLGKNPVTWLRILKFQGVYPGWESIVRHYPRKTFLSLLHKAGFQVRRQMNYGPALCPKWHMTISQKFI